MRILPDLSNVVPEQVQIASTITITLRAMSPTASCSSYGTIFKRAQSPSNASPDHWR
jgi:hypothetical protein